MKRRAFLRGSLALLGAPAIVRASSLMAISPIPSQFITRMTICYGAISPEFAELLRRRFDACYPWIVDAQRRMAQDLFFSTGLQWDPSLASREESLPPLLATRKKSDDPA
jgi:hypothetical protein